MREFDRHELRHLDVRLTGIGHPGRHSTVPDFQAAFIHHKEVTLVDHSRGLESCGGIELVRDVSDLWNVKLRMLDDIL